MALANRVASSAMAPPGALGHPRPRGGGHSSIHTLRPEVDDAPSKAACLAAFGDKCSPGVTECYRCGPDAFDECLFNPGPVDEDHPTGGGCWWCYRCQAARNTTELPVAGGAIPPPEDGGFNVSGAMAAPSETPVGANVSQQDWNWSPGSLAGGQELDAAASSSDAAPPSQEEALLGQPRPALPSASASASATALLSTAPGLYSGSTGDCYAKADHYCGVGVQRNCFQCYGTSGGLMQLMQAQSSTSGPRHWDEDTQAYVPSLTTGPIGGPPAEGRFYWCFSCVGPYAFEAGSSDNTTVANSTGAAVATPRFGAQTRLLAARPRPLPLAPLPWAPVAAVRPQAEWTMSPNPLQLVCGIYVMYSLHYFAHSFGLDDAVSFAVQDPKGANKAAMQWLQGLVASIYYTFKCGWLPGGCSELPKVARSGGAPGPFTEDRSVQLRNENSNSDSGDKGTKSKTDE